MSALTLSGVSYAVGDRTLLSGIDLAFPAGEVTAVSGPSGSGKTTLLSIAGGLVEPTAGTTSYDGGSMWRGTGDPRPEVAFVLQVYGLVPILSARENVSIALRARGVKPAEADERAESALARFHIADLGDRQVEELSGGQMQRVALARGLCVTSGVLLADEPTSELDEGNRALVLRELRREAQRGAVVVVATHDPAVVDACDGHIVIDEGRLTDHVAPVDAAVVSTFFAHAERRVLEEAAPPHVDLGADPLTAPVADPEPDPDPEPAVVPEPEPEPEPQPQPEPVEADGEPEHASWTDLRQPPPGGPRRPVNDDSVFRRPGSEPGPGS